MPEQWIGSRLAQTVAAVNGALDACDFAEASRALHHFIWSEYCDWYLEMAKLGLRSDRRRAVQWTLWAVLETALRLAHPIMPFITEEIWQRLPRRDGDPDSIMIAPWPAPSGSLNQAAEEQVGFLQDVVVEIRRFRHEHRIAPTRRIEAVMVAPEIWSDLAAAHAEELKALAWLSDVRTAGVSPGAGWSRVVAGPAEVYLPLGEVADVEAERARLEKAIAEAEAVASRARAKLENPDFASKAPADVVGKVLAQLGEQETKVAKFRAQLDELAGGSGGVSERSERQPAEMAG